MPAFQWEDTKDLWMLCFPTAIVSIEFVLQALEMLSMQTTQHILKTCHMTD